jgi:RHS repeat-associated protein
MKKLIIVLFCLNSLEIVLAQEYNEGNSFTLGAAISGSLSRTYVAATQISLTPGFSYVPDANTGNMFIGFINPLLNPPAANITGGPGGDYPGPNDGVVGTIPGGHSVSSLGGFNYNIPFEIPGELGALIQPVSLVYNSQNTNGIAGVGWDLSGLSVISRGPSRIYDEQCIKPIKYSDIDDNFYVDGGLLLVINTLSGKPTLFKPEHNPNVIIEAIYEGSILAYFKYYLPDGSVIYYGNSSTSRESNSEGKNLRWYISRVEDYDGNYAVYNYQKTGYEMYLSGIAYYKKDGTSFSLCTEVNFGYEARNRNYNLALAGIVNEIKSRLKSVLVKESTTTLKNYQFTYASASGAYANDYLASVTLNGKDGTHFNPTYFTVSKYNPANTPYDPDMLEIAEGLGATTLGATVIGDINNDGADDIVYVDQDKPKVKLGMSNSEIWTAVQPPTGVTFSKGFIGDFDGDGKNEVVFYNSGMTTQPVFYNGRMFYVNSNTVTSSVYVYKWDGSTLINTKKLTFNGLSLSGCNITFGDFNGDLRTDILFFANTTYFMYPGVESTDIVSPTGYSGTALHSGTPLIGDFNGDGKSDIMIATTAGSFFYSFENNVLTHLYQFNTNVFGSSLSYMLGDFNGDKLTDVLSYQSYVCIYVYRSTGADFVSEGNIASGFTPRLIGDINFDGKSDLMAITATNASSGTWRMDLFCYGNAGLAPANIITLTPYQGAWMSTHWNPPAIMDMQLGDFDGNGSPEINFIYRDYFDYTPDIPPLPGYNIDNVYWKWKTTPTFIYMTNGMVLRKYDYHYDFMARLVVSLESLIPDNWIARKVSKVTDGFNNTLEVNYSAMTKLLNTYTDDEGLASNAYLFMRKLTLPAVNYLTLKDALNSSYTLTYKYSDVGFANEGQGLLGVKYWSEVNSLTNETRIQKFNFKNTNDDNTWMLYPHLKQLSVSVNGQAIYSEDNTWKFISLYELKLDFPYLKVSVIKDLVNDIQNTTTNIYTSAVFSGSQKIGNMEVVNNNFVILDKTSTENRNISFEEKDLSYQLFSAFSSSRSSAFAIQTTSEISTRRKKNPEGDPDSKKEIRYKYFDLTNINLANRVQYKISTDLMAATVITKLANQYSYYGDVAGDNVKWFGKLKVEYARGAKDPDNPVDPETNPASASVKTFSTRYEYSTSGRYVKIIKNEQTNHQTEYTFDEMLGLVTSTKETRGTLLLNTSFQYDGYGRRTQVTQPDGKVEKYALRWAAGAGPQNALYYFYSRTTGSSYQIGWYNKKALELRKEYCGLNGKTIYVDSYYNGKGLLTQQSDPYFTGAQAYYTTYAYNDPLNRETSHTTPASDVYSSVYTTSSASHSITVTSPQKTIVKTFNEANELVTVTENSQTVTYKYYADGNLKSATPSTGAAVTMEYNGQGLRTRLTDPDAGVIVSKYNAFGELCWEQDARGKTTTSTYDPAGRLSTRQRTGESAVSYTYYTTGQLEKATGTLHKITYYYDNPLGLLTKKVEEIDGRSFISELKYDNYNRLIKQIYPSGYYVTNNYDQNGNMFLVKSKDGLAIWEAREENASGQLTTVQQGNNIVTTYGYDARHMPSSIVTGSSVVNHEYQFSAAGNLNYRWDKIAAQKEVFGYDALNRLTSWKIYVATDNYTNPVKQTSNVYQANGNVSSKSDLSGGTGFDIKYGENSYPAHAVTSVVNGNSTMNMNQNADYNADGKFFHFHVTNTAQGINRELDVTYGVDDERRKGVFKNNTAIRLTRYYMGEYELEVDAAAKERQIHYIAGGNGLAAIYEFKDNAGTLYFVHSDYLGSIHTITDQNGTVVERLAYDPWGSRRNPADWTQADSRISWKFSRGFTMHEHLDEFGIINMNGRIYDPLLGRFLNPDPQMQDPDNPQNYNRYAYAFNNPLIYTDPDGEFFWGILIPIVINAITNVITNWDDITDKSDGLNPIVEGLGYMLFGAVSGLVGTEYPALAPAWTSFGNVILADNQKEMSIALYQTAGSVANFAIDQVVKSTFTNNMSKEAKEIKLDEVINNQVKILKAELDKYMKKAILGNTKIPEKTLNQKITETFKTDLLKSADILNKMKEEADKKKKEAEEAKKRRSTFNL